jgi:hypothetical protein
MRIGASSDVIPSSGKFDGGLTAATIAVNATIHLATLGMFLQQYLANWVIVLSNLQAEIQKQTEGRKKDLWGLYNMDEIEEKVEAGDPLDPSEVQAISLYNSQLSQMQADLQAAVKQLDPSITTVQAGPQAINTAINEFIQEAATLVQGVMALVNLRIQ